ncbi:hypothetical protein ACFRKE_28085, partial [Kitasatospora indigofera]|uniref:hypothetical protein n=1 Tax=Kitasatospora indigofera TaxID=67307 RepID=UPI0036A1881F
MSRSRIRTVADGLGDGLGVPAGVVGAGAAGAGGAASVVAAAAVGALVGFAVRLGEGAAVPDPEGAALGLGGPALGRS